MTAEATMAVHSSHRSGRRLGRSTLAVLAGIVITSVLSFGTDQVLHMMEVYPPWGQPMHDHGLFALALAYRLVYNVLGAYFTARLAPQNPWRHVWILGSIGFVLSLLGVVATATQDIGPMWYPVALALTALPCTGLGGWIYSRLNASTR